MTALPRFSPAIERAVQADNRERWTAILAAVAAAMPKPQSEKK